MKHILLIAALVLLLAPITHAQETTVVTNDSISRMRAGAGFGAPYLMEIPPRSTVTLVAISPDSQWLRIDYAQQTGWIPASALDSIPGHSVPVTQTASWPLPTNNCISVVGDSIPYGSVVFKVPGHGFPVIRTTPLAVELQQHLDARGMSYIRVYDRSVPAANLSPLGKTPYHDTSAYDALLQDQCRFVVMPGWNNDLNVVRPNSAEAYVNDILDFTRQLHISNPHTHIALLSHYWGQPQDFVEGYGVGVTYQNYEAHVQALLNACLPMGRVGQTAKHSCLETQPIFMGMAPASFVVLQRSQQQFYQMLWEPVPAAVQPFFDVYWSQNPGAPVYGDGVHLSANGKQVYVDAIVNHLLLIDPNL